jgi:hypothetical protein
MDLITSVRLIRTIPVYLIRSKNIVLVTLSTYYSRPVLCAVLIVCTGLRAQERCDPGGLANSRPIRLSHSLERPAIWPTAALPDDHSLRLGYKHLHPKDMEGPVF